MDIVEKQSFLGISLSELTKKAAIHTAGEISQQPELWKTVWAWVNDQRYALSVFLSEVYANEHLEIILTGAGTSAFIGNILQGPFQKNTNKRTRAVSSTDLVSHPEDFLQPGSPTLLISFARSGNSPESTAAAALANKLCRKVYHLVITCNSNGNLAGYLHNTAGGFIFLLPAEADDKGLAMTGSFTSMLLTGLLISRLPELDDLKKQVERLSCYATGILTHHLKKLQEIASRDFDRAVFLGSGPMLGIARESQLKLQELTDGRVICKYDSFLGLRHGPKVVIDKKTLIVYLFSNDAYVRQYEIDLVNAINEDGKGSYSIGVSEADGFAADIDYKIVFSADDGKVDESFLTVCSVLPAQLLAFFRSLYLGLQPDSPSASGTITRVVEGVVIYPFTIAAPGTQ